MGPDEAMVAVVKIGKITYEIGLAPTSIFQRKRVVHVLCVSYVYRGVFYFAREDQSISRQLEVRSRLLKDCGIWLYPGCPWNPWHNDFGVATQGWCLAAGIAVVKRSLAGENRHTALSQIFLEARSTYGMRYLTISHPAILPLATMRVNRSTLGHNVAMKYCHDPWTPQYPRILDNLGSPA